MLHAVNCMGSAFTAGYFSLLHRYYYPYLCAWIWCCFKPGVGDLVRRQAGRFARAEAQLSRWLVTHFLWTVPIHLGAANTLVTSCNSSMCQRDRQALPPLATKKWKQLGLLRQSQPVKIQHHTWVWLYGSSAQDLDHRSWSAVKTCLSGHAAFHMHYKTQLFCKLIGYLGTWAPILNVSAV